MKDICINRHRGNPQSEIANRMTQHRKLDARLRIYEFLRNNGGCTCEQISHRLHMPYTTVSARLSELKAEKWVVDTGRTLKTDSGSPAAIVRAVSSEEHDGVQQEIPFDKEVGHAQSN